MKAELKELNAQVSELFPKLKDILSYGEAYSDVYKIINQIRKELTSAKQQLGPWETIELDYADRAFKAGFPTLALLAAEKTLAIHQLSSEEYAFGFDLTKQLRESREATLSKAVTAKYLESSQRKDANDLSVFQAKAAANLVRNNQIAAIELADIEAKGLEKIVSKEAGHIIHEHAFEQLLSWACEEAYIKDLSSFPPFESISDSLRAEKYITALRLKDQQNETANILKETQRKAATSLKESQRLAADRLKTERNADTDEINS